MRKTERNDAPVEFTERDFLKYADIINSRNYDYGNDVLYRNFRFEDLHDSDNRPIESKLASAIWLIGKAYSADPTRSAPKNTFSNNGLGSSFEQIAKNVAALPEYSGFHEELNQLCKATYTYDYGKDQLILYRTVLLVDQFNGMIKKAMVNIAKEKGQQTPKSDNVVSFSSKFLHFMCPNLFFIIDSISLSGGLALFSRTMGRKLDVSDIEPSECIDIDTAKSFFKHTYQEVSPLPLPKGTEEAIVSYYTHCLRAYRLACYLHENGKRCACQIADAPHSRYMPRLVDSILMRITKKTDK